MKTNRFTEELRLTLSAMAGFQTHISKCSERGVKLYFIGASATNRFTRSRVLRYGCLKIILRKRQKEREGKGRTAMV